MRLHQVAFALTAALLAATGAGAQEKDAKKDEKKPAAPAPAASPANACEVKKTAKGGFCLKCDRELDVNDVRNGNCKRCESKPAVIEYCVKYLAPKYIPDCHPNKASDKPVS